MRISLYLKRFCFSMPVDEKIMAELFSLCTGVELDGDGLFSYASKIRSVVRELQLRWGDALNEEILPKKFFTNPIAEGKFKGAIIDREKLVSLIKNYYMQSNK